VCSATYRTVRGSAIFLLLLCLVGYNINRKSFALMNLNDNNDVQWQYKPTGVPVPGQTNSPQGVPSQAPANPAGPSVTWTASEYIHHDRGAGWYLVLLIGTVGLAAVVYFLTKDYFATGTIIVLGIIVAIFAGRKPNQLTYELTSSSIKVGQKTYTYNLFKSFAIIREGTLNSISLIPIKRFMPPVTAYFADADEERITKELGSHLPYEERKADSIDKLSRRLRF